MAPDEFSGLTSSPLAGHLGAWPDVRPSRFGRQAFRLEHAHDRPSFARRKPNTPVRGLMFDMGDVLYDATVWRRWLLQLLTRMGLHTTYRAFFHVWDTDFLDAVHRGEVDYQTAFTAFLRSAGLSRGQLDEVLAASQARKRELEANTRPMPGVLRTLTSLKTQGIVLSVLSDSESRSEQLSGVLEHLGLGGLFSTVVSSRDLGTTKPNPANYLKTLEAMGLPASDVAFVGHDAEELEGADAVGMRTFAYNYEPNVVADVYLDRFEQLLQHVGPVPVRNEARKSG